VNKIGYGIVLIFLLCNVGMVLGKANDAMLPNDTPPIVIVTTSSSEETGYTLQFHAIQPDSSEVQALSGDIGLADCVAPFHCLIWEIGIVRGQVVFSANVAQHDVLYRALLDENTVELVDFGIWPPSSFSQSPDGLAIAYIRREQVERNGDMTQGYLLALSDFSNTPILNVETETPRQFAPMWDPQNEWILFFTIGVRVNDDGEEVLDYRIYRVPADRSTAPEGLTEGNSPIWSPDGNSIAYCVGTITESVIFRMGRDGEDLQQLTDVPIHCNQLRWSPDGDKLILSDTYNLYLIDAGEGGMQPIFEGDVVIQDFRWSPDGRHVALRIDNRLYVMELNGENLRALLPDLTITAMDWPASSESLDSD
jgi:Tol biopolymer transport system component